jgi:hypothetical protein
MMMRYLCLLLLVLIACSKPTSSNVKYDSIQLGATQPASQTVPNWYIDASAGNDSNGGTTSGAPLKTAGELLRRWGTNSPTLNQATVITAGAGGVLDPFTITPLGSGSLVIQGTLTQVWTGTVSGLVAKSRSSAQLLKITSLSGMAQWQLVYNSTRNAYAVLYTVSGGNALVGQSQTPVNPPSSISPTELDTWANGDTITGYTPSTVDVRSAGFKGQNQTTNGVFLYHVTVPYPLYLSEYGHVLESFCTTDVMISNQQANLAWSNLLLTSGFGHLLVTSGNAYNTRQLNVAATTLSGSIVYAALGSFTFENDSILATNATSDRHNISGVILSGGLYIDAAPAFTFGLLEAFAPFWGNGIVRIGNGSPPGSQVSSLSTAVQTFLNTGGLTLQASSTGYGFNPSTGAYDTGVALTPANIDAEMVAGRTGVFAPGGIANVVCNQ